MAKDLGAEMLLRNVRLSFPALWSPQTGPNPEQDKGKKPTYGAHLIVEDTSTQEAIKKVLGGLAFEAWGANAQQMLGTLVAQDRISYRNGNTKTDQAGQPLDGPPDGGERRPYAAHGSRRQAVQRLLRQRQGALLGAARRAVRPAHQLPVAGRAIRP